MSGNWWIVAETLKARERDIATLYERSWYPDVDTAAARRRAARRARVGRALRRFFGLTRTRPAPAADSARPCGERGLACC